MLEVTDAALGHLSRSLANSRAVEGTDYCFRMIVKDDETIGLAIQSPESGDQTFEREGTTILAMPKSLSDVLSERILDLGDEGQLLFLPKPN